jgi:hypothetical protein
MKALYIVLVSLVLSGCGFISAPITLTPVIVRTQTLEPTVIPSLTSTPDLAASQIAILSMTKTAQISNYNATSTEKAESALTTLAKIAIALDQAKGTSNEAEEVDINKAKLVFGPKDYTLRHNLENTVITFDPGLSLKDFIVSINFINPYDTSATGTWDYGILFRNKYKNEQYRLTILSNQSWSLVDAWTWTNIFSRNDKHLTATAGEENMIWLIVVNAKAYLFINSTYIQSLDVGAKLTAGDISPVV